MRSLPPDIAEKILKARDAIIAENGLDTQTSTLIYIGARERAATK